MWEVCGCACVCAVAGGEGAFMYVTCLKRGSCPLCSILCGLYWTEVSFPPLMLLLSSWICKDPRWAISLHFRGAPCTDAVGGWSISELPCLWCTWHWRPMKLSLCRLRWNLEASAFRADWFLWTFPVPVHLHQTALGQQYAGSRHIKTATADILIEWQTLVEAGKCCFFSKIAQDNVTLNRIYSKVAGVRLFLQLSADTFSFNIA